MVRVEESESILDNFRLNHSSQKHIKWRAKMAPPRTDQATSTHVKRNSHKRGRNRMKIPPRRPRGKIGGKTREKAELHRIRGEKKHRNLIRCNEVITLI